MPNNKSVKGIVQQVAQDLKVKFSKKAKMAKKCKHEIAMMRVGRNGFAPSRGNFCELCNTLNVPKPTETLRYNDEVQTKIEEERKNKTDIVKTDHIITPAAY